MEYHVYKLAGREYDLEVVSQDPVQIHEQFKAPVPGMDCYIMIKFSSSTKQFESRVTWRSPEDLEQQVAAGARELARLHSALGDKRRISKLLDKAYEKVKPE